MNAYKLADELDKFNKDGMPLLLISQAITMIRKQADRITELEMTSNAGDIADLLQHQADYIAQLEKGLESSIAMNKAQVERTAELERKHKAEFDYAEKLLKEGDK
jgi:hypothetical protein